MRLLDLEDEIKLKARLVHSLSHKSCKEQTGEVSKRTDDRKSFDNEKEKKILHPDH